MKTNSTWLGDDERRQQLAVPNLAAKYCVARVPDLGSDLEHRHSDLYSGQLDRFCGVTRSLNCKNSAHVLTKHTQETRLRLPVPPAFASLWIVRRVWSD